MISSMKFLTWLVGALLMLSSGASAQALIANGDFSVDFRPNNVLQSDGQWFGNGNTDWDDTTNPGNPFAAFSSLSNSSAVLTQDGSLPLLAGHYYLVGFVIGNLSSLGGTTSLTVTYDGAIVFQDTSLVLGDAGFHSGIFSTHGVGASLDGPLVFNFTKTAGGGFAATLGLDDVTLTDLGVPEMDPGAAAAPLTLCLCGLFVAIDHRRRTGTA